MVGSVEWFLKHILLFLPGTRTDYVSCPPPQQVTAHRRWLFSLQHPLGVRYHQLPFGYDNIKVMTTVYWKNLSGQEGTQVLKSSPRSPMLRNILSRQLR